MNDALNKRRERYYRWSTYLAQVDTPTLKSHLRWRKGTRIWGGNQVLELAGTRFFVKKLPITEREYDNAFSTRNIYQLPAYYNYGVGSVGFSPFREIAAHIKTTNWVLDGSIENFPLMYHYRIVPTSYEDPGMSRGDLEGYVKYWSGSKRIGRYMEDRAKARHEAYLFLEYVPQSLDSWLRNNLAESQSVAEKMKPVFAFLREHGIVHFDSHHANILIDGDRPYLTDFGLLSDGDFELSKSERALLKQNPFYDCGEFLGYFSFYAYRAVEGASQTVKDRLKRHYGIDDLRSWVTMTQRQTLFDHLEEICDRGWLKLPASYVETMVKYVSVFEVMHGFFTRMHRGNRKNHTYDRAKLRQSLKQSGYIA